MCRGGAKDRSHLLSAELMTSHPLSAELLTSEVMCAELISSHLASDSNNVILKQFQQFDLGSQETLCGAPPPPPTSRASLRRHDMGRLLLLLLLGHLSGDMTWGASSYSSY